MSPQERQAPLPGPVSVDAPGQAIVGVPPAERRPSGTPSGTLTRSLHRALSWTCQQVVLHPLDSPFLCTYCLYLFSCFTLNMLLRFLLQA